MRPSSTDPSGEQSVRGTDRQHGGLGQVPDSMRERRRASSPETRAPVGATKRTSPTGAGYPEPAGAIQVTDPGRGRPTPDYGPPHGHVIGHEIGGPPPRPRGPNRPFGRIGPYGLGL